MAVVTIPWNIGTGNITLTFTGQGNGTVTVESDDNSIDVVRSQDITVRTLDGNIRKTVTIVQGASPNFRTSDGKFIRLNDGLYFNVKE